MLSSEKRLCLLITVIVVTIIFYPCLVRSETGTLVEYGTAATSLRVGQPGERIWYDDIHIPNSTGAFIALQVGVNGKSNCKVNVISLDRPNTPVFELDCDSMPKDDSIIWSTFIPGSRVRVSVTGDGTNLRMSIPYFAVPKKKYMTESIVGDLKKPDIIPINDSRAKKLMDVKSSVVQLRLFKKNAGYFPCTGFLISKQRILTVAHCLGPGIVGVQALFGWDEDGSPAIVVAYNPKPIAIEAVTRDYALLTPLIKGRATNIKSLTLSSIPLDPSKALNMVHHPGGGPKKATITNCEIRFSKAPAVLLHTCDAIEGSSGAPIFDESMQVVAIHRQGFTRESDKKLNTAVSAYIIKAHIEKSLNE